ncbi:MAG: lamin tail domain-containing protein [Polyangiaceae bacterium]|nr:lamin tail domain-containing protein [Polyangiaceae bacterium]
MKRIAALLLAAGGVGCSESNDSSPGGGGSAATGGGGSAATGGGGSAATGGGGSAATGGGAGSGGSAGVGPDGGDACGLTQPANAPLAINEISSTGDDWVELFNTGSAEADLGGMVLADYDSGTGCPKTTEALTFPAGTKLGAGMHLLVIADKPGAPNTPQTDCLGAATCFHVGFGISGSSGDQVFLLKGSEIRAQGEIPATAHGKGESWCRTPDGTGAFVKCTATPGAKNVKL